MSHTTLFNRARSGSTDLTCEVTMPSPYGYAVVLSAAHQLRDSENDAVEICAFD